MEFKETNPLEKTGSHPVVQFRQIPIVDGPLTRFAPKRAQILNEIVQKSLSEFSGKSLEPTLQEALYSERLRLKKTRPNWFTKARFEQDRKLWGQIHSGLLKSGPEAERRELLEKILAHYAEEIGGRFQPGVYKFATRAVPFMFNWLLNAVSVRHFKPWGMTEQLADRVRIVGEIPHLQRLANQGTILLVPTHQSNMDSLLIGYVIYLMSLPPFSYGAGLNLYSNPLLSFFMSHLGAYTVDRQKRNPIYIHTLKSYSTRILREGVHSIFFPGGGRSRSGALEKKLKLGLLGTALEAQIENHRIGKPNPNVYIVPMVISYHYVLEASSLIEDFLADSGKARFIITDDEFSQLGKVVHFFQRFFASQSGLTVRIGRPMDVFGNLVDENGRSMGPNGTTIDPKRWLTTQGELSSHPQRDHEYTRTLGEKIVERFHEDNTVLSSHLVAFAYFEWLRSKYSDLDLFRFLRLSLAQRTQSFQEFLPIAERMIEKLKRLASDGKVYVSKEIQNLGVEALVRDGMTQLGLLHGAAALKLEEGALTSEDLTLLYYYRNRLTGYGLSRLAKIGTPRGFTDEKGFLA